MPRGKKEIMSLKRSKGYVNLLIHWEYQIENSHALSV